MIRNTYRLIVLLLVLMFSCQIIPASAQVLCNGKSCTSEGLPFDIGSLPSQLASTPQFVNTGVFITQNDLRANFPCNQSILGKYARVSDMYQTVASVAICETDGSTYYWRPQRTDYATTLTQSTGTLNLLPFITSPVIILSGGTSGTLNIVPSAVNAWPGAQFRVYMPATITLPYSINITNLIGNGTITVIQGRDYLLTYTASGWKSN